MTPPGPRERTHHHVRARIDPHDPSGPAGAQPGEDLGARAGPGGLARPRVPPGLP